MSYTITPMSIEDYDEVLALWQRTEGMGLDLNDADSRENTERYLVRNPGLSFVARIDGRIVGAVLCGQDGRRGYLQHLAVEPSSRCQGIGGALVDACLTELNAQGIAKCNIFVYYDNKKGRRYWENRGWTSYPEIVFMQISSAKRG